MTRLIASLGMYDHPAQQWANDALWTELSRRLRARGIDAPEALDRSRTVDQIWRDPNLLFAQACGYPLISQADLALRVIGIPVYEVPDCDPGRHRSYIVARRNDGGVSLIDYLDQRAAINAVDSNTGCNLFAAALAGLSDRRPFFAEVVETGSHRASVGAILAGTADLAAIDAVTFAALRSCEPDLTMGLRVVAMTPASPAPPFVTPRSTGMETVAALRAALAEIIVDPALESARAALFLTDISPGGIECFAALRTLQVDAFGVGYPPSSHDKTRD